MITSNLVGGLGNYLFQIASAYSLSLDNRDKLVYDINKAVRVHDDIKSYKNNILRKINFTNKKIIIKNTYSEPFFHYKPIDYKENLKINGYFQSEKYFKSNRDKILNLFSIDENSKNYIVEKYGKIINENKTCSLHIRRGDYLKLPNHHPSYDLKYYNEAIKLLDEDTKFLIFSDDMAWCKQNFENGNFEFIESEKDYIDLWIMSLCDNNVITNSSFSWWGSWLNKKLEKKVIAPKKWFGNAITHNTNDLYFEKTIKI